MKRSISLFIAILMVLSVLTVTPFTVSAEETEADVFGFAGFQVGQSAIRLVGYTDSLEYDSIGFSVSVTGDAVKEKDLNTTSVFTSLTGDGKVVAATKSSGVKAPVTVYHDYLYGYCIQNITDGNYVFTVVPTATNGEETFEGKSVTLKVTVENGVLTASYLEEKAIAVDPATAAYDLTNTEHGEGVAGIFDGSNSTKLCCSMGEGDWPLTITWNLSAPEIVSSYEIVSGNDHPGRDPKNWVLYGSNDGDSWNVIDEVTDNQFAENNTNDNRVTAFKFETDNATAYQYYKWVVSANNGMPHFQLMEFKLYGLVEATESEQQIKVDTYTTSDKIAGSAAKLFDNNTDSKVCEIGVTQWWAAVELADGIAINRYKIGTGNDQSPRDPKEWKVYGSMNGTEWVEIDHRWNQNTPERATLYTYTIDNDVEYKFYKLEIIANHGSDPWGYDISQVSEWQLFVAQGAVADEKPATIETPVKFDTATIKGSTNVDGGEGLIQIFDGNGGTKVCAAYTTTLWVSAKIESAAVVSMYKITSANDHPGRDPKTWVLYGSNDGETWVELDARDDQSFADRNTEYTYTFENSTAYSYYKLDISSNNGKDGVGLDCVQFSEWQLFVVSKA